MKFLGTRTTARSERSTPCTVERIERTIDGRREVVPVPGSDIDYPADLVLLAIGYTGPERSLVERFGVALDARGSVAVGADYQTSVAGVFAAGDARRGRV